MVAVKTPLDAQTGRCTQLVTTNQDSRICLGVLAKRFKLAAKVGLRSIQMEVPKYKSKPLAELRSSLDLCTEFFGRPAGPIAASEIGRILQTQTRSRYGYGATRTCLFSKKLSCEGSSRKLWDSVFPRADRIVRTHCGRLVSDNDDPLTSSPKSLKLSIEHDSTPEPVEESQSWESSSIN